MYVTVFMGLSAEKLPVCDVELIEGLIAGQLELIQLDAPCVHCSSASPAITYPVIEASAGELATPTTTLGSQLSPYCCCVICLRLARRSVSMLACMEGCIIFTFAQ
jgi:hypothetical protein